MIGEYQLFAALVTFCVVTLFTPGPNNIMLMTTGLNFGLRRGLPHMFGVALGFAAMVLAIGLGLGAVVTAYPVLYSVLKYAGAAYLLYLAWAIATSGPVGRETADAGEAGRVGIGGRGQGRPISFLQAVAFQWVNPKAWVMAVGAISTYATVAVFPMNVALIAGLFGTLGVASSATWIGFGSFLQHVLRNARAVRVFNAVMAALLVASLYPIVTDAWK